MKTVLIIDDEPVYVELATYYLKNAGYNVVIAEDAQTGIRMANEMFPDLILMDLNLPDMNGLQAAHIIKEEGENQDIVIVAYTAYIDEEEQPKILSLYCDDIIIKPTHAREIVEKVDELLSESNMVLLDYQHLHHDDEEHYAYG